MEYCCYTGPHRSEVMSLLALVLYPQPVPKLVVPLWEQPPCPFLPRSLYTSHLESWTILGLIPPPASASPIPPGTAAQDLWRLQSVFIQPTNPQRRQQTLGRYNPSPDPRSSATTHTVSLAVGVEESQPVEALVVLGEAAEAQAERGNALLREELALLLCTGWEPLREGC